ncbi:MAG: 50S ribosomal protein L34 [Candidatus Paceibacterota bacterium]|jgi:large subunit ribosomal protein L34|nr:50S ribosomal protein L34 [Candidatus Paceibacterota bacterium]MDD5555144.1 50S ribosomal protein L34 [Candidatus Paceibacterota bacterium]
MRVTTYRPKKKKRKRTHGFIKRSKTASGRKILKKRRTKKRARLSV